MQRVRNTPWLGGDEFRNVANAPGLRSSMISGEDDAAAGFGDAFGVGVVIALDADWDVLGLRGIFTGAWNQEM